MNLNNPGSGRRIGALAPERIETERLMLRRPVLRDAPAIFARYASDPEVTRFLGWPRHRVLEDTHAFLAVSDAAWRRFGVGPYIIELRADGALLGATGLELDAAHVGLRRVSRSPPASAPECAMTGYVLARDAWGRGYATEALRAMVYLATSLGLLRLQSLCHPEHHASQHVLEKCGFERDRAEARRFEFPNLRPGEPLEVLSYRRLLR